jgi:hypothetical protein
MEEKRGASSYISGAARRWLGWAVSVYHYNLDSISILTSFAMRYCRADHEQYELLQARWSPSTVRTRHGGRYETERAVAISTQQDEPIGIAYDGEHTQLLSELYDLCVNWS